MVSTARWARLFALLIFISVVAASFPHNTEAAQITSRSLTLQTGAGGDAGSKPGGVVKNFFQFSLPSNVSIASISFDYCTIASGSCSLPTGMSTTAVTLDAQNGATGFSVDATDSTNGHVVLSRTGAASTGAVNYTLGHITNPSAANTTFYVRITTYSGSDGATGPVDAGVVAASTATQIVLTGTMPESLIFCTGAAINTTSGIPDCSTATPGSVSFDRLFSPSDTSIATSQMAASTNATGGYVISLFGSTLSSGSPTIPALTVADTSKKGRGQFGTNLRANTTASSSPAVGIDVAPSSNGTNFRGEPLTGYDTVDTFKFSSGDNIADSGNGGLGGSDSQIFTNSYIVNVSGSQAAGIYTTTLTYICTPTF